MNLLVPGREALSWSARVQIALDAARGLEYIHEHTVPVYIHRDIKTANILIDKNFRGKVGDYLLCVTPQNIYVNVIYILYVGVQI